MGEVKKYIAHFGVRGQTWYVRNYQDYDVRPTRSGKVGVYKGPNIKDYRKAEVTEQRKFPKGTKFYNISSSNEPNKNNDSIYVTHHEIDRNFYRYYIPARDRVTNGYEKELVNTKDLLLPSDKEVNEIIKDKLKNKTLKDDVTNKFLNYVSTRDANKSFNDIKEEADVGKKFKNFEEVRKKYYYYDEIDYNTYIKAQKYFNRKNRYEEAVNKIKNKEFYDTDVVKLALAGNPKIKDAVFEELRNRGFNALTDAAGIGLYPRNTNPKQKVAEGKDTLIILDPSIMKLKNTIEITNIDRINAERKYNEWFDQDRPSPYSRK